MLVLSRRPGQSILIGKDIEVVVLGSDGVQVRVGIRAPRGVVVLRRELLKQHPKHTIPQENCPLCMSTLVRVEIESGGESIATNDE